MMWQTFLLICPLLGYATSDWVFPEDFQFGVATSAYQIEGGWNADGKGVSVWDRLTTDTPQLIANEDNGRDACKSYEFWERDVEMVVETGVNFYRFSLAWTRIFPDGYVHNVNEKGVEYYNKLINKLLENGIEPVITLYHWDLPQMFSVWGGMANSNIINQFAQYSRKAFEFFGDRVKLWITFNEPKIICQDFNEFIGDVSAIYPSGIIEYLCTYHLLKAHADIYHIYDREFRATQKGKISITLNFEWAEPANETNPADVAAAEQRRQFEFGIYANPIINFDFPQIVKDRVAERSRLEGFSESRLPQFTLAEKLYIKGTYDFLGLNHYSTWYTKAVEDDTDYSTYSYQKDMGTERYQLDEWEQSGAAWNKVVPWGLVEILKWIKTTYRNPEVLITECGYPDNTTSIENPLEDDKRINFFKLYLNATLEAIYEHNVNVKSFTAWSLMDNFEWQQGYNIKFGLFDVDFDDDNRTRTAKKSVKYIKHVVETRQIEWDENSS